MEIEPPPSSADRFRNWLRTSVTLKLFIICFLVLIMLIPSAMIKTIIGEREELSDKTTHEVSDNWATAQLITGPVLNIPVKKSLNGFVEYVHLLPEELKMNGDIFPFKLKRGIYSTIVYETQVNISGTFDLKGKLDSNTYTQIQWEKSFLSVGISDMRGIQDALNLQIDGSNYPVAVGTGMHELAENGVHADVNLAGKNTNTVSFQCDLNLQGSNNLSFIPAGNTTEIEMRSKWDDPSFQGKFLPDERTVSDSGFVAKWKILELNRNYPQSWEGNVYNMQFNASQFGIDLIESVDDYQKSLRSVKYAIMILALTFLAFFLVEILNGRKIHPFQYILVGLALCLFYILLVSFSEQTTFQLAYLISAGVIILLITLYSISVFKSTRLTIALFFVLTLLYSFLYVVLQVTEYALLIGSIGLTIMLALTMYLTRKVNWYTIGQAKNGQ